MGISVFAGCLFKDGEGAKKLQAKLDEVLNSESHRWYLGKLDPEEAARRKEAAAEFKARYKD